MGDEGQEESQDLSESPQIQCELLVIDAGKSKSERTKDLILGQI